MIVDSHMHVWSMKDVDYYNDKDIYTYMAENKIDKTAMIAISEKENAEMKKVVQADVPHFIPYAIDSIAKALFILPEKHNVFLLPLDDAISSY